MSVVRVNVCFKLTTEYHNEMQHTHVVVYKQNAVIAGQTGHLMIDVFISYQISFQKHVNYR